MLLKNCKKYKNILSFFVANIMVETDPHGAILLKHVLSRKYICFNRRRRVTFKVNYF